MSVLFAFVFVAGAALVVVTVLSAVKTFVLPRSAPDPIVRVVFVGLRRLFYRAVRGLPTFRQRDAVLAFYAPLALLALLPTWLLLILTGYAAMYWALGDGNWYESVAISGSSLLTLGFARADGWLNTLLMFSEATLGLIMVAILIAYLPTIYAAFARREAAVSLLEVRAGSPPSAIELILRYNRLHGLEALGDLWTTWEVWFTELEESHTSLAALVFFRSPKPDHSWLTAAGAVLDAAALVNAMVDTPHNMQADLTLRAGYLALRSIADLFEVQYEASPRPDDPTSVTRAEFDEAVAALEAGGVPLRADREQAWRAFNGWRVNYDRVLVVLGRLILAPPAPWSSDRAILPRGRA
jgi:hypothetical protein